MNLKEYFKKLQSIGYKNILAALLVGIITIFVITIFNKSNTDNNSHRTSCHSYRKSQMKSL